MNLAPSVDVIPWYAGKIEIREYLKRINQESKVSHQSTCFETYPILPILDRERN